MPDPKPMVKFDMSGAVSFDLARGQVTLDASSPSFLVPASAIRALCASGDSDVVKDFASRMGDEAGRRMLQRFPQQLKDVSPEELIDHLGGELALAGLGSLSLEFWGKAMVFGITGCPLIEEEPSRNTDAFRFLCSLLGSALTRCFGREVRLAALGSVSTTARFVVCTARSAARVEGWMLEGCNYGEALARLNASTSDRGVH